MSIMTVTRDEFVIKFEYQNYEELLKNNLQCRSYCIQSKKRGFTIKIEGSCCKGPQGINWFVVVDFSDDGGPQCLNNAIQFASLYEVE